MARKLQGSVVVITGASSGIGRAAALELAREGARLVLAARDPAAPIEAERECRALGADALAVETDVTDEAAVERLRDAALERHGRIDTWVNDAAAYRMGSVEATPAEAVRALFDANVLGVLHGTRAALAVSRRQGDGVIINVGSLAGKIAYAQASAYCATKHAVHAITEALRQELRGTDIHACIVAPATVDTPLYQHAANYTGREVLAMRPIHRAEQVARAIASCARRPRREVLVGAAPRMVTALRTGAPGLHERVQPRMVERDHLGAAGAPATPGNLARPLEPHAVSGGWKAEKSHGSRRMVAAAIAAPVLLLALACLAA